MVSDAYVRVTCDNCGAEEEIQLTATAHGWDDRNIDRAIERIGWKLTDDDKDEHKCSDCLESEEEEE